MCVFSRSVMTDSSWPHGLYPHKLLCPSSSGVFQARMLEWVAISSFGGSSQFSDWLCIFCFGRRILSLTHLGMVTLPVCACGSVMSYSLGPLGFNSPCYTVRMIFQARILEWVAVFSSRGSFQPRDWTLVSCVPCFAGRFFTCWVKLNKHSLFFFPLF